MKQFVIGTWKMMELCSFNHRDRGNLTSDTLRCLSRYPMLRRATYFPVLNSCMGYPIPHTAADSLDVESSYPSVELRDWLKRKWERVSFSHYYWITLNGNYLHKEVQHLSSLFCLQPWLNRKYLLLKIDTSTWCNMIFEML